MARLVGRRTRIQTQIDWIQRAFKQYMVPFVTNNETDLVLSPAFLKLG